MMRHDIIAMAEETDVVEVAGEAGEALEDGCVRGRRR